MHPQPQYNKVHGLLIDPYQRVGVLCTTIQNVWSASITRALIMDPPDRILKSSMKALTGINGKNFSIHDLWDITLDESNYSLHVIELKLGFKLSVPNRIKFEFLSIDQISDEMLDNKRVYAADSVKVFAHLTTYVNRTGIGTYSFRRIT